MNYPEEVADLFLASPIDTPCIYNLYSLHRYIDKHLTVIRGAAGRVRDDLAFSDKPFTELLQALDKALRWLQEDPERHSQMLLDNDVEMNNNPTSD